MRKENVSILIDTCITHNFIDVNIAKRLNLFIYRETDIRVRVSDGRKIDGIGKCHKVKLQLDYYNLEYILSWDMNGYIQ